MTDDIGRQIHDLVFSQVRVPIFGMMWRQLDRSVSNQISSHVERQVLRRLWEETAMRASRPSCASIAASSADFCRRWAT